jgi:hypothetical protein
MPSQAGAAVGNRNAIGTQAGSYGGARGCASASRAAGGSDAAGGGCLWTLSACEVRAIDALCSSHLHIDTDILRDRMVTTRLLTAPTRVIL